MSDTKRSSAFGRSTSWRSLPSHMSDMRSPLEVSTLATTHSSRRSCVYSIRLDRHLHYQRTEWGSQLWLYLVRVLRRWVSVLLRCCFKTSMADTDTTGLMLGRVALLWFSKLVRIQPTIRGIPADGLTDWRAPCRLRLHFCCYQVSSYSSPHDDHVRLTNPCVA